MWSQISLNPSARQKLPFLITLFMVVPLTPILYSVLDEFLPISIDEETYPDKEANATILIYNRIPRSGSRAVEEVLRRMADLHNFTFYRSTVFNQFKLSDEEQRELAGKLLALNAPYVYSRMCYYINFESFGLSPVYVNLVRDPVEQAVSYFYSVREMGVREMPASRRNMTLEDCVRTRDIECFNTKTRTVGFFCGNDEYCRLKGDISLSAAMRHVEKTYSVVGITEDMSGFFYLLQAKHPDVFTGAYQLYQPIKHAIREKLKTRSREAISPMVRAFLTKELRHEYDFYNYIKKRFYDQMSVFHVYKKYLKRTEIEVD